MSFVAASAVFSRKGAEDSGAFRAWFGASKIVDAAGRPLRVYHGTTQDFEVFDPDRTWFSTYASSGGLGIFFSRLPEAASHYASTRYGDPGRIIPVYLSIQRPYIVGSRDDAVYRRAQESKADAVRVRRDLIAAGYDGVVSFDDEIVAFYPQQVKSAVGNSGAFDPANPSILHGLGDDEQRDLRCRHDWKSSDGLVAGLPLDRALPLFVRVGRRLPYRGESTVTVYRGVPRSLPAAERGIRSGDWVALMRAYAAGHGGSGSVVIARTVGAHEVVWAGTDEQEWWYCPR